MNSDIDIKQIPFSLCQLTTSRNDLNAENHYQLSIVKGSIVVYRCEISFWQFKWPINSHRNCCSNLDYGWAGCSNLRYRQPISTSDLFIQDDWASNQWLKLSWIQTI
jgi:hypothetical protein